MGTEPIRADYKYHKHSYNIGNCIYIFIIAQTTTLNSNRLQHILLIIQNYNLYPPRYYEYQTNI